MLGKLFKYEARAVFRLLGGFYLAVAISLAATVVSMATIGYFFIITHVLMLVAVVAVTIVVIAVRYYRTVMGDGGYLTFTLPVTADQVLLSRLFTDALAAVSSFLVVLIGGGSILVAQALLEGRTLREIAELWNMVSPVVREYAPMVLLFIFLQWMAQVLMLYGAMTFGPHILSNRLGGSVVGYLIEYAAVQIFGTALFLGLVRFGMFTDDVMPQRLIPVVSAWLVAEGAAFYLLTRHFLTRKLNLS